MLDTIACRESLCWCCNTRRNLCEISRLADSIVSIAPDAEKSIAKARRSWIELILLSCSLLGHRLAVHGFPWRLLLFLVITTQGYDILHDVIHKTAVETFWVSKYVNIEYLKFYEVYTHWSHLKALEYLIIQHTWFSMLHYIQDHSCCVVTRQVIRIVERH